VLADGTDDDRGLGPTARPARTGSGRTATAGDATATRDGLSAAWAVGARCRRVVPGSATGADGTGVGSGGRGGRRRVHRARTGPGRGGGARRAGVATLRRPRRRRDRARCGVASGGRGR